MFGRSRNSKELDPPPIAAADPNAKEVLRVWSVAGGPQQVVLKTTWSEPGVWGLLLVDIANHAANAYANEGADRAEVLARIKELFDAEWENSTDQAREMNPN